MIVMTLAEVASAAGGRLVEHEGADADLVIDAVTTDSRHVPVGDTLFVALAGEQADGHQFAARAVEAGAAAALVERRLDGLDVPLVVVDNTWDAIRRLAAEVRRRVAPTVVAITGSVGKTTVKDLTAAAVGAGRRTHAAHGSFNNELGVPLTLLGLVPDTEVLVAEIGARHLGDIAQLAPTVSPDIAVVTAVADAHLEIFGTIDHVATAKQELVDALDRDGLAVLNVADPRVAAMAGHAPNVLRVGLDVEDADVTATNVSLDRRARPRALVHTPWGQTELTVPVAGRHQLTNGLLALAVAGHLGIDLEDAAAGIAEAKVSAGRGAVSEHGGVVVLDDAYNANPTSTAAALSTLVDIERTGASWAVLGQMAEIGGTSAQAHRRIGALAVELGVDHLLAVGAAASQIAAGANDAAADAPIRTIVREVADADEAVGIVTDEVASGDAVLVKASRVAALETVAAALTARGDTKGTTA